MLYVEWWVMGVEVIIKVFNEYLILVDIFEFGFEIFVFGCGINDVFIVIVFVIIYCIFVKFCFEVVVDVDGVVDKLFEFLICVCFNFNFLLFDLFFEKFFGNEIMIVFV